MKPLELEKFLFERIPLAEALRVKVIACDAASSELHAPLAPNRNHLGTAFGGSLGAVLILAGYTWLYNMMSIRGLSCHVLLKKSEVDYLLPVEGDLQAIARAPESAELEKFMDAFKRKGTARTMIKASITSQSGPACTLTGEFIAKKSSDSKLA